MGGEHARARAAYVRRQVRETARAVARSQEHRNEAIRRAYNEGATLREIAELAGLTHGRIHQIVRAAKSSEL